MTISFLVTTTNTNHYVESNESAHIPHEFLRQCLAVRAMLTDFPSGVAFRVMSDNLAINIHWRQWNGKDGFISCTASSSIYGDLCTVWKLFLKTLGIMMIWGTVIFAYFKGSWDSCLRLMVISFLKKVISLIRILATVKDRSCYHYQRCKIWPD